MRRRQLKRIHTFLKIGIALIVAKTNPELNGAVLAQISAFFVVVGHTFPIFFEFRGGKGVATSLGVILLINWKIGLICLTFALILMILSKMVSLGSISAAILFPVLTLFITDCYIVEGNYVIFGIIMAVFIAYNHRSNIKRLLNGTENKISFKKKEN